jgi:hypothetical protein
MRDGALVALPGGCWLDGRCQREAALRPLTGDDEAWLLEAEAGGMLPAERSTALLARCLTRLGAATTVTPELARSLTVGDREALLLQLRRLTFGDDLPCTVSCPAPSCGERLELPLRVGDLLLPPYPPQPRRHQRTWTSGGTAVQVGFRLPTGADQEAAAAAAAAGDPAAGASLLLRRCVEDLDPPGGPPETLPEDLLARLDATVAALDPQAELRLSVRCARCGLEFSTVLDAGGCLYEEVSLHARHLYQGVHLLALHYHWGERELMGMTARERSRYLGLLEEALAGAGR